MPRAPGHTTVDLNAVVTGRGSTARRETTPLCVSSLRPSAPFVLLNVSRGDHAVMVSRECGCAPGDLGWTTHLHAIRSGEKLTVGGMTLLDTDLLRVLEERLPAQFDGRADRRPARGGG